MSNLFHLLVAGLATGAIYALVAIGFTLLWQTSQTINFAQGEFVMLPAFFMLAAMHARRAVLGRDRARHRCSRCSLLGVAFKQLLVDPMMRHGVLPLAIATMALAIVIKEAVKEFFSAEAQPFPSLAPTAMSRSSASPSRCRAWRPRPSPSSPSSACSFPQPHAHRPPDAGDGAEPDRRAHPRHPGRAHDPAARS